MPPTSDDQIRFLAKLQRPLDEGAFVASYKFALLLALADLCIEHGTDSGAPLEVSTDDIADRFIRYYWEQARPYPAPAEARILRQNTGSQAAIGYHRDILPATPSRRPRNYLQLLTYQGSPRPGQHDDNWDSLPFSSSCIARIGQPPNLLNKLLSGSDPYGVN